MADDISAETNAMLSFEESLKARPVSRGEFDLAMESIRKDFRRAISLQQDEIDGLKNLIAWLKKKQG